MMRTLCFVLFSSIAPLAAQTIDVIGSTARVASNSGRAKANSFRVDTTSLVLEMEFYLDFQGTQDVTYFIYRAPDEFGVYDLEFSVSVPTTGAGQGFYSSGQMAHQLLCGNRYVIGVSFPSTTTYYFGTGGSQSVSFGEHTHAYAVGLHPLGATLTSSVDDQAIYHQRLTTVSLPGTVDCVGTGCSNSGSVTPPRLLVDSPAFRGNTSFTVQVRDAAPASMGYFLFGVGLSPVPIPLFGCDLQLNAVIASGGPFPVPTSGDFELVVPIGNDPALVGFPLSMQSIQVVDLLNAVLDFTNAVQATVN